MAVSEAAPFVVDVWRDMQAVVTHDESDGRSLKECQDRLRQRAFKPYDLARGPLFRMHVTSMSTGCHLVMTGVHHVVTDGWSNGRMVWPQIAQCYQALLKGEVMAAG